MAIDKHLNILDYALSALWRKKLKAAGMLTVFAIVIFLIASFQLTTSALTETALRFLDSAPEITIQKMTAGRQDLIPLQYLDRLQAVFGIRTVVPRVWGYHFDESTGANYTVLAVDATAMPAGNRLGGAIDLGALPANGEAVVGRGVRQSMQLANRQVFSLFRPDLTLKAFRLKGTFKEISNLLTYDTIFMNLADGRDLFQIPENMATDLCVYVANPVEIATIAKKIAAALPDTRVLTRDQLQKTYRAVFGWRSGFASVCLLTALTAFIIFAWDKASGLTPEERKEIAVLKIIGWQTADILALRFWEGFIVSSLAFLIGYSLAFIHVLYWGAGLFKPILLGWSIVSPPLTLAPSFALDDSLLIFSLTVFPYLAATIIPSWRGAIIPPDSAMT